MMAGRLRNRIWLQKKTDVRDEFNAEIEQWVDYLPVWSDVQPGSTKEFLSAQQLNNTLSHEVTIRYRKNISPDLRIRFGTRHFNIHGIRNKDEKNHLLILNCEEFFYK